MPIPWKDVLNSQAGFSYFEFIRLCKFRYILIRYNHHLQEEYTIFVCDKWPNITRMAICASNRFSHALINSLPGVNCS